MQYFINFSNPRRLFQRLRVFQIFKRINVKIRQSVSLLRQPALESQKCYDSVGVEFAPCSLTDVALLSAALPRRLRILRFVSLKCWIVTIYK